MMLKRQFLRARVSALPACLLLIGMLLGTGQLSAAESDQPANAIEKVEASAISGQTLVKVTLRQPLSTLPSSFTVSTPSRIAFDFLGTENTSGVNAQQYALADLQSVNVIQAGSRTRLVLNLNRASRYETRIDGNNLYISLGTGPSDQKIVSSPVKQTSLGNVPMQDGNSVQSLDFQAESPDVAKISVDLSAPNPLVDVKRQGSSLVVSLMDVKLPDRLARRLDVRDFGTPVTNATATTVGQGTQISISTRGEWEYNVTQLDTSVKIEVRRRITDPNSLVGAKELQGKTVSFNFTQPVPVSQMIGIFQDITGLNFVMMPGVTGEIDRLKMENTPVETAINVICRMYGLAMRRFDSLVVVGKATDVAKYEKEESDLKNVRLDTEPIEQESIKARYRPAAEIVAALTGVVATYSQTSSTLSSTIQAQPVGSSSGNSGTNNTSTLGMSSTATGKSMISSRGSISSDPVTNTVFVEETRTQIAKIRERVVELDRPVRQVMIEARIVSVNTTFSRALGTKLGFSSTTTQKLGSLNGHAVDLGPLNFNSNMAAAGNTSAVSFSLFNPSQTRVLNLELTATENDGLAKNIASPKILTQDGRQATITDGQTLFFQLSGGTSGPTTVSVDAATKLEVTPQIGADGKVQMKVYVNKGGVGTTQVQNNPSIIKQEVTTNVVIENGGTLMLGGVFTQIESNTTERVPLLGDIPYVGWLFKLNTKKDDKTELLIFLTPRIVSEELTLQ
jgi:type IV pilus assembly protein PilQ